MSRIIAFAGSPRQKSGASWILLRRMIEGAESGGATVKLYNLNDPGVRGSQGYVYGRDHAEGMVNDVLTPMYADIAAATGIIVASPIYFGDISGQTKIWLDRMLPMLDGASFAPRHPGKRVVTIFSQGDPDGRRFEPAIERFHACLRTFGWRIVGNLVCPGVTGERFVPPEELMERAFLTGRELAG